VTTAVYTATDNGTIPDPVFRKIGEDWVIYGPASKVSPGPVSVRKKDGTFKEINVRKVSKEFPDPHGKYPADVPFVFGYYGWPKRRKPQASPAGGNGNGSQVPAEKPGPVPEPKPKPWEEPGWSGFPPAPKPEPEKKPEPAPAPKAEVKTEEPAPAAPAAAPEPVPVLEEILDLLAAELPVLLVGPAGAGKTTLAFLAAERLGRPAHLVSLSGGSSEASLLGRSLPDSSGAWTYRETPFVHAYEQGGVAILDELDAADPNAILAINAALTNGHLPLPARHENPVAKRHPGFAVVACANTWGSGADRQYVGRNQLDEAFLDRFRAGMVHVDYDRELEAKILPDPEIAADLWRIRDRVAALKIRRVVSTRFFAAAAKLHARGWDRARIVTKLTLAWTPDEIARVGVVRA
jgi:MoxR-like ATPase